MYLALSKYNDLAEIPEVASISLRVSAQYLIDLAFFKCIGTLFIYSIKQCYDVLRLMLIEKKRFWLGQNVP